MDITITINADSSAFGDYYVYTSQEVARILHEYAEQIDGSELADCKLRDSNGNTVGTVAITE